MSIVASSTCTTNCSNAQSKARSSITAVLKFEPLRHLTRLHVLVIKERKLELSLQMRHQLNSLTFLENI